RQRAGGRECAADFIETSPVWEAVMRSREQIPAGTAAMLILVSVFGGLTIAASAQAPKVGDPPEASNMRLVGYDGLQARSAYQPTIHRQGERFIAYVGHHGGTERVPKPVNPLTGQAEFSGTSILDVTDPAHPKYLRHIPGQEGTYEQGGAQ